MDVSILISHVTKTEDHQCADLKLINKYFFYLLICLHNDIRKRIKCIANYYNSNCDYRNKYRQQFWFYYLT